MTYFNRRDALEAQNRLHNVKTLPGVSTPICYCHQADTLYCHDIFMPTALLIRPAIQSNFTIYESNAMSWHENDMTHCDMTYHDMAGECITPPTGSRPVHCPSSLLTILPRNFVELTFTRFSKEPDCFKIFSFFAMSCQIFKFLCQSQKGEKQFNTHAFWHHKNPSPFVLKKNKQTEIPRSYLYYLSWIYQLVFPCSDCVCRYVLPCSRLSTLWHLSVF